MLKVIKSGGAKRPTTFDELLARLEGQAPTPGLGALIPASFQNTFYVVLVSPPPGGPGEDPDCHFPKETEGFGPIPARIRRRKLMFYVVLALSAIGL